MSSLSSNEDWFTGFNMCKFFARRTIKSLLLLLKCSGLKSNITCWVSSSKTFISFLRMHEYTSGLIAFLFFNSGKYSMKNGIFFADNAFSNLLINSDWFSKKYSLENSVSVITEDICFEVKLSCEISLEVRNFANPCETSSGNFSNPILCSGTRYRFTLSVTALYLVLVELFR